MLLTRHLFFFSKLEYKKGSRSFPDFIRPPSSLPWPSPKKSTADHFIETEFDSTCNEINFDGCADEADDRLPGGGRGRGRGPKFLLAFRQSQERIDPSIQRTQSDRRRLLFAGRGNFLEPFFSSIFKKKKDLKTNLKSSDFRTWILNPLELVETKLK